MEDGKEINSERTLGQVWRNGVKYLNRKDVFAFFFSFCENFRC